MINVKWNSWIMASTCQKLMVQLMCHIDSWRDVKKITIYNGLCKKVKGYFNLHINIWNY
jgi:hypothetical protein